MTLLTQVLIGIVVALLVAAISTLLPSVRRFLFYRRQRLWFPHDSALGSCRWDVNWRTNRLTLEVEKVHNDHLENVNLLFNRIKPGHTFPRLEAHGEWVVIPKWPIQVRVGTIVRRKVKKQPALYEVEVQVMRRRWK